MKKRLGITLSVLGCALLIGGTILTVSAFSKPNNKNLDLSVYTSYVEYRNNGGMKTYTEWVKDGSVSKPKEHDRMVYKKGEKGADVVSAEIDKDGNLALRLSNGKTIKTPLPKAKQHSVHFYLDDLLLEKKQVIHGKQLEIPKLDFAYNDYWYLDKEYKEHWNITSKVEKCLKLYAKIDPSKKFKVTLIDEELKHSFSPVTVSYGAPYELPKPFDMNSEYDFAGWEMPNEKKEIVERKGNWKMPKDITLKATWAKKTGVKVNEEGICEFGLYPQSKINDSSLLYRIKNTSQKSARGNPVVDGYEYFYAAESYYRFEPVKWVLLNDEDGGKNGYRLVSRNVIDASPVEPDYHRNVYSFPGTPLHQWMNGGMLNGYLAFGSVEKNMIRKIDPNNSSAGTISLISTSDYEKRIPKKYKVAYATDFAQKKPIYSFDNSTKVAGWWTSSIKGSKKDGYAAYYGAVHGVTLDTNLGMRPVIRVASIEMGK